MATLLSIATGNFTTASTWGLCDSTSENDSWASSAGLTTSNQDSSTFTPGAITVSGIAVALFNRAASPSGTFTITLRNSTDSADVATVTVNISDLPAWTNINGGWCYFKFASDQTLIAAKAYIVRMRTSASSQLNAYSNTGTNWKRQLVTSTTQAPASGDKLIMVGAYTGAGASTAVTVTLDNTATTSFGTIVSNQHQINVSTLGTLACGTSGSTGYYFKWKGNFSITRGGVVQIGTSGTPIPDSSTCTFEMHVSSARDSSFEIYYGGTFTAYGMTKTQYVLLGADAASSATSITLATTPSNWKASDDVVFAPTGTTHNQYEVRVISSDVTTTAMTITVGLTNAHKGTAPIQGEVLNVTRNIIIKGTSQSLYGWINVVGANLAASTFTPTNVQFQYLGGSPGLYLNMGGGWATTTNVNMYGCVIRNTQGNSNVMQIEANSTASTCSIQYQSFYDAGTMYVNNSTVGYTFNYIVGIGNATRFNWWEHLGSDSPAQSYTGLRFSGANNDGLFISPRSGYTSNVTTFIDCVFHTNNESGCRFYLPSISRVVFENCTFQRNTNYGVWNTSSYGLQDFTFSNCKFSGNAVVAFKSDTGGGTNRIRFVNCQFGGETSFAQPYALDMRGVSFHEYIFDKCDFGNGTTNYVAHNTADVLIGNTDPNLHPVQRVLFRNCTHHASTIYSTANFAFQDPKYSYISFMTYGATAGDHRTFYPTYSLRRDTVIYNTAAPSERLTPSTAAYRLESAPVRVAVVSGSAITANVYVRKSTTSDSGGANYNGSQPRLIVRANPAVGIDSDTVLDTMTVAVGNWEQLTGTTTTPTADGVLEFFVDFDGTAGWINVDDYSFA
jgi:hypothetical protein